MIGNAVLEKGKEVVEDKLGIKLPDGDKPIPPDLVAQLQIKQMDHEEWLVEAGIRKAEQSLEETKAYLADTQSARQMQIAALQQSDVFSKRFVYYFAIGWSVATMVYLAAATFAPIPPAQLRLADTILGFMLGTLISTIIQFFFGSSMQSKHKDEANAALLEVVKNVPNN